MSVFPLFPTNYSTIISLSNGVQYQVPLLRENDGHGFDHYYVLMDMTNFLVSPMGIENDGKKQTDYIFEPVHPAYFLEFFLIIFGILCNSVTALIILCTRLIRATANKYIFVILVADTVYLICAFCDLVLHIRTINFHLCALDELINHCAVYASSICIVLLTVERFLAIVCPMEHMQIADSNRWLLISIAIIPFLICQTVISFLILKDISAEFHIGYVFKCKFEMSGPLKGLDFVVDNLVQFLVPLFLVAFLNIVIAFKIRNSTDSSFLTGSIAKPKSASIEMKTLNKSSIINAHSNEQNNGNAEFGIEEGPRSPTETKIPKIPSPPNPQSPPVPAVLFIIPTVYMLLNTPFYTARFIEVSAREFDGVDFSLPDILTAVADLIFIANFASNAILYAISSSAFRQQVLTIFARQGGAHHFSSTNMTSISHSSPQRRAKLSQSNERY